MNKLKTFKTYQEFKQWMCDFHIVYEPLPNSGGGWSMMPIDFDYDTQCAIKEHFRLGGEVSIACIHIEVKADD